MVTIYWQSTFVMTDSLCTAKVLQHVSYQKGSGQQIHQDVWV